MSRVCVCVCVCLSVPVRSATFGLRLRNFSSLSLSALNRLISTHVVSGSDRPLQGYVWAAPTQFLLAEPLGSQPLDLHTCGR
jgi:hypothetical protein